MTELEMLTLAAKAVGITIVRSRLDDPLQRDMLVQNSARNPNQPTGPWNPREDDGDALRLAVKLELEIRVFNGRAHAGKQNNFWCTEHWFPDGDVNAATRRAIVRAAAEIGKQIKGG